MKEKNIYDRRVRKPFLYHVKEDDSVGSYYFIEKYNIHGIEVEFKTPNLSAICLNVADSMLSEANSIHSSLITHNVNYQIDISYDDKQTIKMYDYIEKMMTAIIMSFTAVETLANALIPNDYIFVEKVKGGTASYDKSYIERNKSTIDKLKEIIPKALKIPSPATYDCWVDFCKLARLRNDVIHLKSDALTNAELDKNIIFRLLSTEISLVVLSGRGIIKNLTLELSDHMELPILNINDELKRHSFEKFEDINFRDVMNINSNEKK